MVFGVWSVYAFYHLVRRAFNEVRALVSCAVLAVMPNGIFVDTSFLPDPVMVSLVVTSVWMFLAYLQDRRIRYLGWGAAIGTLGLLTKISGFIVCVPMLYIIWRLLPAQGSIWLKYLFRLMMASILMLTPVVGYYVWALHVSQTYPPYHVAARGNWVWDAGFATWLQNGYFLPDLFRIAKLLWGVPLLALALVGLLLPSTRAEGSNLRWLFHYWLLGSAIFYGFGAQELVINIWNFHIVDPALAGLSAQGLLVAVAALARFRLSLIGRVALILAIVTRHGFELSHLGWVYAAHARQSYEMGAALAQLSRPYDLVITVANSIGDPVAIYYSRRRGWVFPPPWPGVDWAQDIVDEPAAIQLFDRLRSEGAKWFGIVAPQRINFSQTAPRLMKHIESTTELVEEDRDWAIYRISPPSK